MHSARTLIRLYTCQQKKKVACSQQGIPSLKDREIFESNSNPTKSYAIGVSPYVLYQASLIVFRYKIRPAKKDVECPLIPFPVPGARVEVQWTRQ